MNRALRNGNDTYEIFVSIKTAIVVKADSEDEAILKAKHFIGIQRNSDVDEIECHSIMKY